MEKVYVIGAGMSSFGYYPDRNLVEATRDTAWEAITSSGVNPKEIGMFFSSHMGRGGTFGQRVLAKLGLTGGPVINCENACASGGTAAFLAKMAIQSGACDMAMVIGAEKMTAIKGFIPPDPADYNGSVGMVIPAGFAMIARTHMERYGTTREQIAMVSVKNHANGCLNPRAQFKMPLTVEQILDSKIICDPMHIYECCPTSDGCAAVILANEKTARKYTTKPVEIVASVVLTGEYVAVPDRTMSELSTRVANAAYEQAGFGPRDIDVCELHDPFAITELWHYENLGFCERGEGGRFIEEGKSEIDGEVAVNPSGGLLSKGHPLGATGVAQVAEIFWQLRGEAGERQVKDAKVGMAHTMGGPVTGLDAAACSMQIMQL